VRPLRRRRGIGTSRPSSEDRSLASARRPGSSSCEALPLRDSAGISPASLGTAPSQVPTVLGRRKLIAVGGLLGATTATHGPERWRSASHNVQSPSISYLEGPWRPLSWLTIRSSGNDTPGGWNGLVTLTICSDGVTRCPRRADNRIDAGGVGTPELTPPRLHRAPGRGWAWWSSRPRRRAPVGARPVPFGI
jgi:hypothetical protein